MAAFAAVRRAGGLTARAHFAPPIETRGGWRPEGARWRGSWPLRSRYDEGALAPAPGITVRNAKLFLDGVIAAPALTGAVLEPYLAGSEPRTRGLLPRRAPRDHPGRARPGRHRSHMHADGDGAVRAALDGIAALRKALPGGDIRPAIAHDEIVVPPTSRATRSWVRFRSSRSSGASRRATRWGSRTISVPRA